MTSCPTKRKCSVAKSDAESIASKRRHKRISRPHRGLSALCISPALQQIAATTDGASQVRKLQGEGSNLKDAVSKHKDVEPTGTDSIECVRASMGTRKEASAKDTQLSSSTGNILKNPVQPSNRINSCLSPFEQARGGLELAVQRIKNELKRKDDRIANLTKSQENLDCDPNDNSILPSCANKGLKSNTNANGCAKRARRRRKRARKRQTEQLLQCGELVRRSVDPFNEANLYPKSRNDRKLIHRPDTGTEPQQRRRAISPELPETPEEANYHQASVLESPKLESNSTLSCSSRKRREESGQVFCSLQEEQEAKAEKPGNDIRQRDDIGAARREATNGDLQLTISSETNLRQQLEASKPTLQHLNCDKAELHQGDEQIETELRAVASAQAGLQKDKLDFEVRLSKTKPTSSSLQDRVKVLEEDLWQLHCEDAQLQQRVGRLRKLLLSSRRETGDLKQRASLLDGSLLSCKSEKAELQEKMSQLHKCLTAEFAKGRARCRHHTESIRNLRSANNDMCSNLSSVIKKHNDAVDEISRLKPLNDTLGTKVTTAQNETAKLQSELGDTTHKLLQAEVNANVLSRDNELLQWDLKRVSKQAERVEADLRLQLKTAQEEAHRLRHGIDDTTSKLRNAIANVSGLGNHNASLKVDLEHVRQHVESVKAELLSANEKRNQEALQMNELKQSNAHLVSESEKWQEMIEKLRAVLNEITEKHNTGVNNIIELHERSTRLQSAQEYAESQATRLQAELSDKITEHERTKFEMQQLIGRLLELEKRFQQGKIEENKLRSELSKRTAKQVKVFHDNQRLSKSIACLEKERDEAKSRSVELQSELSTLKASHEDVVQEVRQLRDDNAALQNQYQHAKDQMSNLQSKLSNMTTKHRQTISKVNVLTHNNSLLEADVEALRKEKEKCGTRGQWEGGREFERFFYGS